MKHYLYKITNKVNGKAYIGITGDPKRRKYEHFRKKSGTFSLVRLAVAKYGVENFSFDILVVGSREYIVALEPKAILLYGTMINGYNLQSGGCPDRGSTVDRRSDDKPLFVSGFWFPNFRTAYKTLRIPQGTLRKRLQRGVAGDVCHPELIQSRADDKPIFVEGFWFPAIRFAKKAFGRGIKRLGDVGYVYAEVGSEALTEKRSESMKGKNTGENNGMYGKRNTARSRSIVVEGITYSSISEAVRQTHYTKSMLEKRLAKGVDGFKYA